MVSSPLKHKWKCVVGDNINHGRQINNYVDEHFDRLSVTVVSGLQIHHLSIFTSAFLMPSSLPNAFNNEMEKTANTITTTAVSMNKSKFSIY
jgi:hypothetical protein